MVESYRYIVVDDERLIRASLIKQINESPIANFIFVGEASDGNEGLQLLERSAVDIILCDIRMPELNGLQLAKQVSAQYPWIKILFISGYSDFEYAREALHYGVSDYLLKPISSAKLHQALHNIAEQLKNEEERELALFMALIESEERSQMEAWRQCLLKQQPAEVIQGVRFVLLDKVHSLHKRPRILYPLLSLWSKRFLQNTGFSKSEPLKLDSSLPAEATAWDQVISEWILQLNSNLHTHPPAAGAKIVAEVKQLIHKNYAQNLTLEELSAAAFLNKTYLAGLFKQVTGQTIGQYIQEVRMKEACLLLETTRKKVQEIAEMVGYHDLSHFSKIFKQNIGVTPQTYRNMAITLEQDSGHE